MSAPFEKAGKAGEVTMLIQERGEVFTHKDDDGTVRTFLVTMMRDFAENHSATCPWITKKKTDISAEIVAHIQANMGIETDRLDRLCEPYLNQPIIGVVWSSLPARGNQFTVVDGNHRIVKKWLQGETEIEAWLFHEKMWSQFLLDVPEEIALRKMADRSGVIEAERQRLTDGDKNG